MSLLQVATKITTFVAYQMQTHAQFIQALENIQMYIFNKTF